MPSPPLRVLSSEPPRLSSRPPRRHPSSGTPKKKKGFFRALFGAIVDFFVGSFLLIAFSIVFFTVLAVSSFMIFAYYIGGDEIPAPDLTARSLVEALSIAHENTVSIYLDREEPSSTLPDGSVISQNPRAGTKIKRRTPIRVVISTGSRHMPLPSDLVSLSRRDAGIRLREMGLTIGEVAFLPTAGKAEDVVLATDPPPGTGVPPGSKINLLVSIDAATLASGKPPMPDVRGLTRERAEEKLAAIPGVRITVRTEASGTVETGKVHGQSPAPGKPIGEGDEVEILIEPPPSDEPPAVESPAIPAVAPN